MKLNQTFITITLRSTLTCQGPTYGSNRNHLQTIGIIIIISYLKPYNCVVIVHIR